MLQDPKKRDLYDRGGDPLGGGIGGFNGGFGPGGFDFSNLVDAMFGQQTSRGPRSRVPPWSGRVGSTRSRARGSSVRYHEAAAGGYGGALPTLQRVGRHGGLPAG